MHANHREEVSQVYSGDIAAMVGLRNTSTGDSLSDEKKPILLESLEFPEPVINLAVEPKSKADQDKLGQGLQRLAEEDPTFKVFTDAEAGQTIIAGMANFTWRSLWIVYCVSLRLRPISASPRLPTVKPLRSRLRLRASLSAKAVDAASMARGAGGRA